MHKLLLRLCKSRQTSNLGRFEAGLELQSFKTEYRRLAAWIYIRWGCSAASFHHGYNSVWMLCEKTSSCAEFLKYLQVLNLWKERNPSFCRNTGPGFIVLAAANHLRGLPFPGKAHVGLFVLVLAQFLDECWTNSGARWRNKPLLSLFLYKSEHNRDFFDLVQGKSVCLCSSLSTVFKHNPQADSLAKMQG